MTETLRVEPHLQLGTLHEQAESVSNTLMVEIDSSALGRDVSERAVSGLPLVTRNFTQIAGLSPGVVGGVINAGELALGGTALSQIAKSNDGIYVHGANLQTEIHAGWLLEVGYVGTRGTDLMRQRSLNQAMSASPSNPIRGDTSDTVANIGERVPVLGVPPDSLQVMETEGDSWYNALELSLTKRLGRGLEFLASYTFSKTLDTDGADINSTSAGTALTLGDQDAPGQRWGRASIDRPQRFAFSATWTLPSPSRGLQRSILGGWDLAAVAVVQSGSALTIAYTNANNVFGISEDRAQLTGTCTKGQLISAGPIGPKLNNYFNKSCFTTPPVIGADGVGTAFGKSGTGIVDGPGEANLDLAVSKAVGLAWPHENSTLQLRAEFFNAFNHPQFSNPDTNFSSPTFGVITSTAMNARVGQLALRWSF